MKQGKDWQSFVKRTHWSQQTFFPNNTRGGPIHGHHQKVNTEIRLITFLVAEDGEALYSQQKKTRADCGSNHELLIANFRLKLNKVGKNTRPFRYDLNQVPYYAVEVTKIFQGLDLISGPEELQTEVYNIVQGTGGSDQNHPRKRNATRQNACLRRPYK